MTRVEEYFTEASFFGHIQCLVQKIILLPKMHHQLMIIRNMKFMWHFTFHAVNSSRNIAPKILIVAVKMVTDFWYLFGFICELPHSIIITILLRNIHAVNILILRKISSTAATSSSSLYASQKFMWFLHHLFMNK